MPTLEPIPPGWPKPPHEDAFYGLVGEIIGILAPESEADGAALLVQTIVGFGSVLGNKPHFQVGADRHALNLYGMLVGNTSKGRKGSSWSLVESLVGATDPVWRKERILRGLSSGEGLVQAVRDGMDSPSKDGRLLVVETEWGSAARALQRRGNTLSPTLRGAWDSGNLGIMTRRSPLKVTGAHVSVIAHTTGEELLKYLDWGDVHGGLMNRFLIVLVRRSQLLPDGGNIAEGARQALVKSLRAAVEFAHRVGRIDLTEKARVRWAEEYPQLSMGVPGVVGAVTSRAEAQVRRLAAVYAMINRSDKVTTHHLGAALAVWKYCSDSAHFVFGGPSTIGVEGRLLSALQRSSRGLTRTEISNELNNHFDKGVITAALESLEASGTATFRKVPTDGRAARLWYAVRQKK